MTYSAKLVFQSEVFLSLSRIDAALRAAAAQHGLTVSAATETLTGVTLDCDRAVLSLDLDMSEGETRVALSLKGRGLLSGEEGCRRLAGITQLLLKNIRAPFVIWLDNDVLLPRDAFLSAFDAPDADAPAVAPRRVRARPTASPTRRVRALRSPAPANAADGPGIVRLDAHVRAYDAYLRDELCRDASEAELDALRQEAGITPAEARMSTWAVSIAVATVSLPVAVPVLVHNVVRGEDMRVASLAMGLAGLFVALDSSGAMAGIVAGL
ncbi:hypothetical protein SAMN05421759_10690 [Roseivivax lentus]|uniref:Uncharacterized protein n=1 Tax=Roseivivax lentus TaxID=633194 RepID=A0A1N7MZM1_9RHOB|nr:hypothetical protein [Roseivivax lentus]SIS91567.1 hypothetical protein SAMN05421759_10690 [Roseivivax lentus]